MRRYLGSSEAVGRASPEALREAEALASEHGEAELWVQHSDRLARGDGRTARHLVEISLWALKANVAVRSHWHHPHRTVTGNSL
jgi:hypothetical protein